jgi:glycosyltransferase involved in cell wall biosynthesis
MKILFIHQSLPGQFGKLAHHLAQDPDNEVLFVTKPRKEEIEGVRKIQYRTGPISGQGTHPNILNLQNGVVHGQAVAKVTLALKKKGFVPDIVYAHPGWGEALYIKDIHPDVPLLNYCEFYYHAFGADTFYDPDEPVPMKEVFRIRTKNAVNLLSLESCDWGISPTHWQWRQHPKEFRDKISVIHDGVDTSKVKPDPEARLVLEDGTTLDREREVVTYVARNLEPYRGFPAFMRAAQILCARRPNCHVIILGGDRVSYGRRPPKGTTYREMMLAEVDIDPARLHILGSVPYAQYLKILQVSSAHVYLTMPFVLSWSMMEAMAAECLIVGSNTPPVAEVIEDGKNGLLADFFSPEEIAERIEEALDRKDRMAALRRRARETVLERYDIARCLPRQVKIIEDLAAGRRPAPIPP